jgi:hypothetical protein
MVGDSFNSSSVQFRNVIPLDEDRSALISPDGRLSLFKIEDVDFEGFFPSMINNNPDAMFVGQNLTAVGYNSENQVAQSHGQVYESPIRVTNISESSFTTKMWVNVFGLIPGE